MKRLGAAITVLVMMLLAFPDLTWRTAAPPAWKQRARVRQQPGPFPSDWFMQQRSWPESHVDAADYFAAAAEAERLRERTLDEHPPWIPAGPNNIGGRVADIVGHPTNAQIFYVAAASGGVFKTINGGTTWTAIFDNAPGLSMGALAMDPTHPDTVYVGTGEACSAGFSYFGSGLYRTTNGGQTWTPRGLANSRYIARVAVNAENPQILWVAVMGELYTTSSERGVYRSTDGGATWTRSLFINDSTGACDVVIHPENSQIVYAAMWQRIRTVEVRRAGGRASGIHRSTNGGQSWERLQDGLPPAGDNVGRIGLAISASQPNILYATYADHPGEFLGAYRTADGGETWNRMNDGSLSSVYSNFGWYFGDIRVRPDNPNMVFVLGVPLFRSTNAGQNWSSIGQSVHVDHHALWFHPAQPATLLLGNDGGVYRSTNNGNSWTFLSGLPINQFYAATVDFQNPQRLYGGTQDNGTLRTLTGGLNDWDHIHGGDGFYVAVDPTDASRIYAEYQWGWLDRSEDGGADWETIMNGIDETERTNWSTPVVMAPQNPSTLYYGAQRLYRTTNRGTQWTAISPDLTDGGGSGNLTFGTITTIGLSPLSATLIYAGTDDANVWVTRDGGATWNNRSAGLPERWITRVAPDPLQENVVCVTPSGFRNAEQNAHIFRSTNYGQTWENISGNLPAGPLNDVIFDPAIAQRLYVASDFGTFVSVNGGEHWAALGELLPRVPVLDLELHAPTRKLTAATYGRSMYTLDLTQLLLNRPPVIAGYSPHTPDTVVVPVTLQFAVNAADPDGDSLRYEWRRGGNLVSTDSSVTLEFTQDGIAETITLRISDGDLTTARQWNFVTVRRTDAQRDAPLAHDAVLLTAFPNPFNGIAQIEYSLARPGAAQVTVYDVLGRHVTTLLQGTLPAGRGRLQWAAGAAPAGTYFIRLQTSDQVRLTKVLLIR